MIDLLITTATGTAALRTTTVFKAGVSEPVRVIFDTAPGSVADWALTLADGASTPAVLAFLDVFVKVNEFTWAGVLDTNDTRLVAFMAAKLPQSLPLELALTLDGVARATPNLTVTVQRRLGTGPTTTEGGPNYDTVNGRNAALAAAIGVTTQAYSAVLTALAAKGATPVKFFSTGGALLAGAADFNGQILSAADGSFAYGSVTYGTHAGVSILNDIVYLKDAHPENVVCSGEINAVTFTGGTLTLNGGAENVLLVSGGSYRDNVLNLQNTTGGYSSIAGYRPADGGVVPANSAAFALGYGAGTTRGNPGPYNDRVYLGLSPKGTSLTDNPPDFIIAQENKVGAGSYLGRERLLLDGATHTLTLRGWDDNAVQGPLALRIEADGAVTIGQLLKLTPLASAPASPAEGWLYAGTDHHLYFFNGTTWKQLDN